MEKAVKLDVLRPHHGAIGAQCQDNGRVTFANALRLDLLVAAVFRTLLTWQERASQRHHLAQLDERYLEDMGISAAERSAEVRKPFWKE
ncbi:MAG: DUF1127 domain-containing protein [Pseudomonadota bacterium]